MRKWFNFVAVGALAFALAFSGARVAEAATVYDIEPIYSLPSTIPGYAEIMDDIDFDVDPGTRTKDYENFLKIVQKELDIGKKWEKLDSAGKKLWQWGRLLGKGGLWGVAGAFSIEGLIYGGVAWGATATGSEWNDFYCSTFKNNDFINFFAVTIDVDCNFSTADYEDSGGAGFHSCLKYEGTSTDFINGVNYCWDFKVVPNTALDPVGSANRKTYSICVTANGVNNTVWSLQPFILSGVRKTTQGDLPYTLNTSNQGTQWELLSPMQCGGVIISTTGRHADWWYVPAVIEDVFFKSNIGWESPTVIPEVELIPGGTPIWCQVQMSDQSTMTVTQQLAAGEDVVVGVTSLCSTAIEEVTIDKPDEVVTKVTGGKTGLEDEPVVDVEMPDTYKDAGEQYPLCAKQACKLILNHKVGQSWVSCFVDPVQCAEWFTDKTTNPNDWQCKFGVYVVSISECAVYKETFKPKTTPGTDITDPETGVTTTVTTATGSDNSLGSGGGQMMGRENCWDSWGAEIMENLVNIVLTPVKCALAWAFVPDPIVAQQTLTQVQTAWDTTVIGGVLNTLNGTGGFLPPNLDANCLGPKVEFELPGGIQVGPVYPIAACEEPFSTYALISRVSVTATMGFFAAFSAVRFIASTIGYTGFGRAGSDE